MFGCSARQDIDNSERCLAKCLGGALGGEPHHMGTQHHLGGVKEGMVGGGLVGEHIKSNSLELTGFETPQSGIFCCVS